MWHVANKKTDVGVAYIPTNQGSLSDIRKQKKTGFEPVFLFSIRISVLIRNL